MITKEENIERLYDILKLDKDWDGYESEPIPIDIVYKVKSLLDSFITQPKIFPTGSESIQFEWENKKYYLEVDIYGSEFISCDLFDNINILPIISFNTTDITENEMIDEINKIIKNYINDKEETKGDSKNHV